MTEAEPWHRVEVLPFVKAVVPTFGVTVIFLLAEVALQLPPVVVNTKIAIPEKPAGAVHVAFRSVFDGLNIPPAVVDHSPPVAVPPTDPPNGDDVPSIQIDDITGPALAVGATTVKVGDELMVYELDE